jgi:multidrug efflux pump subunit AcrB
MLFMSSNSSSNGVVEINVTFEIGTNIDQAALNVKQSRQAGRGAVAAGSEASGRHSGKNSTSFLQVLHSTRLTAAWTICLSATTSR